MKNGMFITIEGMDGSGKTTQINKLKEYFSKKDKEVVITREPGGTIISEIIRELVLNPKYKEMTAECEMLLYAAGRAQHVREKVIPSLEQGKIVISDRFVESSIVYQGYARKLGEDLVTKVNEIATGGLKPNITFFIDLDHKTGMQRKKDQKELDRLEKEKADFHAMVRKGYHELIEKRDYMVLIDGSKGIEEVHNDIVSYIESL